MKISKTAKCQQILRKAVFAKGSRKHIGLVSAQKLLDNKESTEESDYVSALGENSQSHLTMNIEIEILRNPY